MVGSNRLMVEMFDPIQGVIFYDQIDRIELCKQIHVVVALINSTRSMLYDLVANRPALVHQQKSMLFTLFHSIISVKHQFDWIKLNLLLMFLFMTKKFSLNVDVWRVDSPICQIIEPCWTPDQLVWELSETRNRCLCLVVHETSASHTHTIVK